VTGAPLISIVGVNTHVAFASCNQRLKGEIFPSKHGPLSRKHEWWRNDWAHKKIIKPTTVWPVEVCNQKIAGHVLLDLRRRSGKNPKKCRKNEHKNVRAEGKSVKKIWKISTFGAGGQNPKGACNLQRGREKGRENLCEATIVRRTNFEGGAKIQVVWRAHF